MQEVKGEPERDQRIQDGKTLLTLFSSRSICVAAPIRSPKYVEKNVLEDLQEWIEAAK